MYACMYVCTVYKSQHLVCGVRLKWVAKHKHRASKQACACIYVTRPCSKREGKEDEDDTICIGGGLTRRRKDPLYVMYVCMYVFS